MDRETAKLTMQWFVRTLSNGIGLDLSGCLDQQIGTSKHLRRERALAYLLDSMTSDPHHKYTEDEVIRLITFIENVQGNLREKETKVGFERAEKRLRWLLAHPDELRGKQRCVACGAMYEGDNHVCTNAVARGKDATMAHDSDVEMA